MSNVPQPRADEALQEGTLIARVWYRWVLGITNRINGAPELPEHTVATLPAATGAKRLIYVHDEAGGAVVAFSDGTNWRRTTDRAVVS